MTWPRALPWIVLLVLAGLVLGDVHPPRWLGGGDALSAGASGYLLKRLSPKKLLEAIEEVCAGGSPMSAPIARKVVKSFKATPARGDESADLSPREHSVLDGLAEGLAYKQIADQLGVSIHTVRNYIRRIYEKLHVRSRTEAVAKFLRK